MTVHVGIGQPGPLVPEQQKASASLASLGVSVSPLRMDAFNFSTVINRLAGLGKAEYLLLLNDDVTPLRRDWLSWMVACLHDGRVAAAGARLLYPDGRVQHGGVLMGLGGLCEHIDRGISRDDPGYAGRAMLAQELSAVTAACMLVRRREFEALGGLDESYPSAFNDVDFCLRLREAGFSIAYVPQAELTHHELQTYGSHYRGDRAPFEVDETTRMRRRWADVIAADPFHNPNLRLEPGLEWRPAFPPRRSIGSG
jgi:cellulose synthase/poly-beta-1,6-N-acetylglucosamine synthase-like glycosyltransferase